MTSLAPEKFTGTRCGEMIGQGMIAYRCELEQGHAMRPEDDPEPHYAVEIGRTVRSWQAWKQRQMDRAVPSTTALGGVQCPTCGGPLSLPEGDREAVCLNVECDQQPIPIAQPKASAKEEEVFGVEPGGFIPTPEFAATPEDEQVAVEDGLQDGPRLMEMVVQKVFQRLSNGDFPTKQREGDQPLPDGGHACVQDRIIAEMEESKRVGEIRYGSVLRTFNGRDSLLDAAEEARDLHVYLTQIRMEAEATRDQLEVVVLNRLRPLLEGYGIPEDVQDGIVGVAVDAVMGWVTGQQPETTGSP